MIRGLSSHASGRRRFLFSYFCKIVYVFYARRARRRQASSVQLYRHLVRGPQEAVPRESHRAHRQDTDQGDDDQERRGHRRRGHPAEVLSLSRGGVAPALGHPPPRRRRLRRLTPSAELERAHRLVVARDRDVDGGPNLRLDVELGNFSRFGRFDPGVRRRGSPRRHPRRRRREDQPRRGDVLRRSHAVGVRRQTRASQLGEVRRDASLGRRSPEQARQLPREPPTPVVRVLPGPPRLDDDAAEIVEPETPPPTLGGVVVVGRGAVQRGPRECRDPLEHVRLDDQPVVVAAAPVVREEVGGSLHHVDADDVPRGVADPRVFHRPRVDHSPNTIGARFDRGAHRLAGPRRRAPDAKDHRRARIAKDGGRVEQRVELVGRRRVDARRGWGRVRHRGYHRDDVLRAKDAHLRVNTGGLGVRAPVGISQPRGARAVVDDQNRARRLRGGGREARREDARGERPTREIMTRVSRSEKHRSAGRVRRRPMPRSCLRRTVDLSVVVFPMDFVFSCPLPARSHPRRARFFIFFLGGGWGCPRVQSRREIRRVGNRGGRRNQRMSI
ncbi:predicted protein [Micromonas commoda]|uniref:Uncharacterized protein n=1 Tax=Micromonas commoda (strain RCC299 / NOUM17 / CCMP2709) TaxID=296587 RepID=C1EHK7_MICCC|nr:predicted protein [Micromonas commoda]ACO67522.1 predicted protein [Micromonas commoda]|eukprot:XP_002506264.1 predicted protein [Micromonas commoda]